MHRFWLTVTRGGYAGHGECYAHPEDLIWWAKGGDLRGESWKRIGFLRDHRGGRRQGLDAGAGRRMAVEPGLGARATASTG